MEAAPHPHCDTPAGPETLSVDERRRLPIPQFFGRTAFRSPPKNLKGSAGQPRHADEQSGDRLVSAERELARMTELQAAYATQPNITPGWQRQLAQQAEGIAKQRAEVERLRAVVRAEFQARADAAALKV